MARTFNTTKKGGKKWNRIEEENESTEREKPLPLLLLRSLTHSEKPTLLLLLLLLLPVGLLVRQLRVPARRLRRHLAVQPAVPLLELRDPRLLADRGRESSRVERVVAGPDVDDVLGLAAADGEDLLAVAEDLEWWFGVVDGKGRGAARVRAKEGGGRGGEKG